MRLAEGRSDIPHDPQVRADEVLILLEQQAASFRAMPDAPGQQIHSLFAGLYRETTAHWLKALRAEENSHFGLLLTRHFYEIYQTSVPTYLKQSVKQETTVPPAPWRKYHWLAKRLTMRSPISLHLLLISLGVRAHVYHDLSVAMQLALADHKAQTDQIVENDIIIGAISEQAFFAAALDYIHWHRIRQTGWRALVLTLYATSLHVSRPFWLYVLEGWRRRAWRIAHTMAEQIVQSPKGLSGERGVAQRDVR